jgi:hypothetical protein
MEIIEKREYLFLNGSKFFNFYGAKIIQDTVLGKIWEKTFGLGLKPREN